MAGGSAQGRGEAARAHGRLGVVRFIGARHKVSQVRTPREQAAAPGLMRVPAEHTEVLCSDGPERAGSVWVGPSGSAQTERSVFSFFWKLFSMQKYFQKSDGTANTLENPKNCSKIPKDRLRHEQSK
jgi:hypothetical protein